MCAAPHIDFFTFSFLRIFLMVPYWLPPEKFYCDSVALSCVSAVEFDLWGSQDLNICTALWFVTRNRKQSRPEQKQSHGMKLNIKGKDHSYLPTVCLLSSHNCVFGHSPGCASDGLAAR